MSQSSYVKCHHVYEPQREDELKLSVGDVVEVTSKEFDTWWVGKNLATQQSGWFPTNFVTPTDKPEIEPTPVEPRSPPQQMPPPLPDSLESPISQPEVETHKEKTKPEVPEGHALAEVQHDYEAQGTDELSLEKGAIVTILEEVDGWYKGDLNGRIGLFPANFVSRIENKPANDLTQGDSEAEEAQQKPKGFKLAAYGVKQGGIGSLFSGGIPLLKKSNRHSLEIPEHQAPVQEAPTVPPKKNIPLPPPPQESEHEEVAVSKPSASLPPPQEPPHEEVFMSKPSASLPPPPPQEPQQEEVVVSKPSASLPPPPPQEPEAPRVSTDSSLSRKSTEEPTSPTTKRKSGFGGFRPPIPKIPIPKFPSLPKKQVPPAPQEVKPVVTSPSRSSFEPPLEAAQPTSPIAPHAKVPLPPIPSGLPPSLPSKPEAGTTSPPQIPHVRSPLPPVPQVQPHIRSPLPPVPQEPPHIRSPLPPVPQEQPHIRSPLPPVPQEEHNFETPSADDQESIISVGSGPDRSGDSHSAPALPSAPKHPSGTEQNEQENAEAEENIQEDMSKPNHAEEDKVDKTPAATKHSGPKLALVEDDFDAQSSSHLTLRKGGVVTILEQGEDWWRGEMNGKIGLFPPHLVKIIEQPTGDADTQESEGNAPRGGFKLAAYGVKQGGIGSLFAGGLPLLRKTGRRMGSEETPSASSEPERSHTSSASTPQMPTIPSRSNSHEAPQPASSARTSTQDSVPQASSAPARTSAYDVGSQISSPSRTSVHETAPQVPNVPSRVSTRESLPPVPSVPSRTSSYEPEPEPEPQMRSTSRSSTQDSLPQVPSVPSRTSTYEPEPQLQSPTRSTYETQPQSPSVPSRTSTHESLPQIPNVPARTSTRESLPQVPSIPSRTGTQDSVNQAPSIPSRTASDSQPSITNAYERSLDSSGQAPPSVPSESEEYQPHPQEDNFEPQLAPAIPARSGSTEISPQIPSRVSRRTSTSSPSREQENEIIRSRSSIYSVDSEHSALENTVPTSRNGPEFEGDAETPEPAHSSRTSFYHVDTPRSPTPGRSTSFDPEPHSPTTPLPSGNGSQTELPMPTGLPHRENHQERSPPTEPRRTSSFGLEQTSGSDRVLPQRNSVHGYDSPRSPVSKRYSAHGVLISSPLPSQEETTEQREETQSEILPEEEEEEKEEVESKMSLKSENEEFYEASEDLEVPHEPEPTPNIATPRYVNDATSISTNLDQVDRALETRSMEDQQKRNIDQVEPNFVPEDHSKKQDVGSPDETPASEMPREEVTHETNADAEETGQHETSPALEENKTEGDELKNQTPSLPALPESQPLSSLTKGRPMRTKRRPTPATREPGYSQTELLEKAIEEDTQSAKETKPVEPSVEPAVSRDPAPNSSETVDLEDEQPRLVKPSAFRGQATPFAKLSFGKSGVPGLPNKTGHVGELGRRISGGDHLESKRSEGATNSDVGPRKFSGVAGATQALAMSELENKMRMWVKEEMEKLREELMEERQARLRLEEELRQLKEARE